MLLYDTQELNNMQRLNIIRKLAMIGMKSENNEGKKMSGQPLQRQHKVCPQCGSENIFFEIGFVTGTYKCNDCGYVGPVIFEFNDKEYKKFLAELGDKNNDAQ
jgi:predicted RNA-binding Zn-ribbon protein involved in translation (DUF1610 family)